MRDSRSVSRIGNDRVLAVPDCDLRVSERVWEYAQQNASEIDTAWRDAVARNPQYFNGIIYLVETLTITAHKLEARLLRTDFKSYLYWRHAGYPDVGVLDGFGSALLKSCDGAIVLGRQRAGNVNAGLAYLPGGFIDGRDVAADGSIDIAASIARELAEETGLQPSDLQREPGFVITQSQAQLSLAIAYRSKLDATQLKRQIETVIAADAQSELVDAVIVRDLADMAGLAMPQYARVLLATILPGAGGGA